MPYIRLSTKIPPIVKKALRRSLKSDALGLAVTRARKIIPTGEPVAGKLYEGAKSYVKPIVQQPKYKLTRKQWMRLTERLLERHPRGISKESAESVMRADPATQVAYSRLYSRNPRADKPTEAMIPEDLPAGLARRKYVERYPELMAEHGEIPSAKVFSSKPYGVSYSERVYEPIPKSMKTSMERVAPIVEQTPQMKAEQKLQEFRLGTRGGEVSEAVKETPKPVRQAVESKKYALEQVPAEELRKRAFLLDNMWKFIGGGRTLTGKMWGQYMQSVGGRYRQRDPRSFFIKVGLEWFENPSAAAKKYPRESASLTQIWAEFMKEYGGQL